MVLVQHEVEPGLLPVEDGVPLVVDRKVLVRVCLLVTVHLHRDLRPLVVLVQHEVGFDLLPVEDGVPSVSGRRVLVRVCLLAAVHLYLMYQRSFFRALGREAEVLITCGRACNACHNGGSSWDSLSHRGRGPLSFLLAVRAGTASGDSSGARNLWVVMLG